MTLVIVDVEHFTIIPARYLSGVLAAILFLGFATLFALTYPFVRPKK